MKGSAGPGAVPETPGRANVSPSGASICTARQRWADAPTGTVQACAGVVFSMSPAVKVTVSLPIETNGAPRPKSPRKKLTVTTASGAVDIAAARRETRANAKLDPERVGASPTMEP